MYLTHTYDSFITLNHPSNPISSYTLFHVFLAFNLLFTNVPQKKKKYRKIKMIINKIIIKLWYDRDNESKLYVSDRKIICVQVK